MLSTYGNLIKRIVARGLLACAITGAGSAADCTAITTEADETPILSRTEAIFASQESAFSEEAIVTPGHPYSTAGSETEPGLEDYPHIFSTDVWNPQRFWYTERPNILNQSASGDWDAMKIINTDRPDFTDVASVVGKGVLQVETGYSYRERSEFGQDVILQTVPEALLRWGTTDHFEWRLKWDLGYTNATIYDRATNSSTHIDGVSDISAGFKWAFVDQDDWVPMQTIVGRLVLPTGSKDFSGNTVQPGIIYIYNWQVRRWWFIRGATGVDWLTESFTVFNNPDYTGGPVDINVQRDYRVRWSQSISSYMQISKRVGMFAEWFALYRQQAANNAPDNYYDFGLYYYVTPNFQLDARIGQRINGVDGDTGEYFSGFGVS